MKFASFIIKNLFRNKVRSGLTILLMSVIFFFVATLLSILDNFTRASDAGQGQNRLGVQSAISLGTLLPFSHEEKIRKIPGVVDTGKLQWVQSYYKDPHNFFANFAVDADKMATIWDDYQVPPDQMAAFKSDRRGALVGEGLAKRFDWKIGEHIPLRGTIFPFNPDLTIRGIFHHKVDTSSLFFRMDYFQESLGNPGKVGTFWVKVADPKQMARISQQIDEMFKNSDFPTETFTEKAFQQQFISMIGNIKLLFSAVSVCAMFMVILLAAITMSMSARERVTEIAVLKAIGFGRGLILTLLLTEFVLISAVGGTIGVVGARVFYLFVDMGAVTQGFLQNFSITAQPIEICLTAAILVGILAGGVPALRSANGSVVDGLRKVV